MSTKIICRPNFVLTKHGVGQNDVSAKHFIDIYPNIVLIKTNCQTKHYAVDQMLSRRNIVSIKTVCRPNLKAVDKILVVQNITLSIKYRVDKTLCRLKPLVGQNITLSIKYCISQNIMKWSNIVSVKPSIAQLGVFQILCRQKGRVDEMVFDEKTWYLP